MEREVSVTPSVSLAPEWPEPLRKLAKSAAMLRSGGGGGVVAPKLQYMEEREVKFYKNYYVAHVSSFGQNGYLTYSQRTLRVFKICYRSNYLRALSVV